MATARRYVHQEIKVRVDRRREEREEARVQVDRRGLAADNG